MRLSRQFGCRAGSSDPAQAGPKPRRGPKAPRNIEPANQKSGLPSMSFGISRPKYFNTVGAMSRIEGAGDVIRRLDSSTPDVVAKSYPPWSPLHFFMLG